MTKNFAVIPILGVLVLNAMAAPLKGYQRAAESAVDVAAAEAQLKQAVKDARGRSSELPMLQSLATFYSRQERPGDQADVYVQILEKVERTAGRKSLATARFLADKGAAESRARRFAQADRSFRESLSLLKDLSAEQTVFRFFVTGMLGQNLSLEGRKEEGAKLLAEAVEGLENLMGQYSPIIARLIGPEFIAASAASRARSATPQDAIPGTTPSLLSGGNPEYSADGRKALLSGSVTLVFRVRADGIPENFWVVKPLGAGLDEKAVETIRTWRFRPATRSGAPVSTEISAEVVFSLR